MLQNFATLAILAVLSMSSHATALTDQSAQSAAIAGNVDSVADVDSVDSTKTANSANASSEPLQSASQQKLSNTLVKSELTGDYNEAFYKLTALNRGLPPLLPPPNLQTPLATLEFFHSAMLQKQFGLAAYALNLNPIAPDKQTNLGPELAKKLDYLLAEKGLYLFDELPDRADGLVEPPLGSSNPITGIPRRSIKLGYIDYKERHVPIYLERVQAANMAPVWVFSAQAVVNIEVLYDMHKPADFERYLPQWLTIKILGMRLWEIGGLFLFMLLTMGFGYLVSRLVSYLVDKYTQYKKQQHKKQQDNNDNSFKNTTNTSFNTSSNTDNHHSDKRANFGLEKQGLTDLLSKITVPVTITISFALVYALVSGNLPRVPAIASSTRPVIWIGLVFSSLWLGVRTINFFGNRYQDFEIDSLSDEQFIKQRQRRTYLSIFRRIFIFVMILGGLWISLSAFTDLSGLGTTLLTSAGIVGAIIGIAAQPTLGNIIAGFQVAITQPVRIGDTIMLDGVWSEVEDLRYTYAVLKTWDDRRLIVPMKYFVTEVLENWSHTDIKQSSAVYLYVDYGADIDAIEAKFEAIVKGHKLWDKQTEPNLLVTAVTEEAIKLRCKVSADSPANAWTLECEVRKQLLDYLADEQPQHLPTERITLAPRPPLKAQHSNAGADAH